MPLWAEGIRSAIYFSQACGRAIAGALEARSRQVKRSGATRRSFGGKRGSTTLCSFCRGWSLSCPTGCAAWCFAPYRGRLSHGT